jgi:hypothetical protein
MTTSEYYHKRRDLLVSELGGLCCHCGSVRYLEFHHVGGSDNGSHGIGGWQQLLRLEREYQEGVKLQLLCRNCHGALHAKLMELVCDG